MLRMMGVVSEVVCEPFLHQRMLKLRHVLRRAVRNAAQILPEFVIGPFLDAAQLRLIVLLKTCFEAVDAITQEFLHPPDVFLGIGGGIVSHAGTSLDGCKDQQICTYNGAGSFHASPFGCTVRCSGSRSSVRKRRRNQTDVSAS
jgi:hypothetical protein